MTDISDPSTCELCGAYVSNEGLHIEWHAVNDRPAEPVKRSRKAWSRHADGTMRQISG